MFNVRQLPVQTPVATGIDARMLDFAQQHLNDSMAGQWTVQQQEPMALATCQPWHSCNPVLQGLGLPSNMGMHGFQVCMQLQGAHWA